MDGKEEEEKHVESLPETMGSAFGNVGDGLSNVYKKLEESWEQSLAMMQTMNTVMKEVYKTNVKVTSRIKPTDNHAIEVELTVANKSRFPVVAMTGALKFETSVAVDVDYLEADIFNGKATNLLPLQEYCTKILIKSKQLSHYDGEIVVSFPNAMNQNDTIDIHHTFGVYIIDQLTKTILENESQPIMKEGDYEEMIKSYPVSFVREIMDIHPIKGMEIGMFIRLSSLDKTVALVQIQDFSSDYGSTNVAFYYKDQDLQSKLIKEFDMLSI